MSKVIKTLAEMERMALKMAEKQCYYLADKVADKVKKNIEEFIKEYYKEYSPVYYDRTWKLLNSVVKTKPKRIRNGYEVEVYIDTSIEYSSTWKGEPWTMANTMYMANQGMHGRYDGGYPHLWDEAYSDTYDSEEIIGQFRTFMQSKGINVTIR